MLFCHQRYWNLHSNLHFHAHLYSWRRGSPLVPQPGQHRPLPHRYSRQHFDRELHELKPPFFRFLHSPSTRIHPSSTARSPPCPSLCQQGLGHAVVPPKVSQEVIGSCVNQNTFPPLSEAYHPISRPLPHPPPDSHFRFLESFYNHRRRYPRLMCADLQGLDAVSGEEALSLGCRNG